MTNEPLAKSSKMEIFFKKTVFTKYFGLFLG